jgi:lipopolysaccharide transport system permease protein
MKEQTEPYVVYTPHSQLRHPIVLMRSMLSDLRASKELAWRLFIRDLSAQYRQSFLGIFWAFLPPILLAIGFTFAKSAKIISMGSTEIPYPAYVILSMALWQTFAESLNRPLKAVSSAVSFMGKVNFPREAIILSKLGEILFNFAIKLALIFAVFVWFEIPVTWKVVFAPFALISLVFLGLSLAMLLAPLGALFHDVTRTLTIFTGIWLFLTPVVYPVPRSGFVQKIVTLNPVTPLLVTTRELATTGILSSLTAFLVVCALTAAALIISWITYRLSMPYVIERFGG